MPNTNTPMGLRPIGTLGSAGYMGKIQIFNVPSTDATAIGIGDPVSLNGTGDANGVPQATRFVAVAGATTQIPLVGVMVGIVPNPTDLALGYRKASTAMDILVDIDPNTIFEVQDSNTTKTTGLAVTTIGLNVDLLMGTVDTVTGNGKTILEGTTAATTANLPVKILRLSPKVGNEVGSYAKWQVLLNAHAFKAAVAGN